MGTSKQINDMKKGMLEAACFGYALLEVGEEMDPNPSLTFRT